MSSSSTLLCCCLIFVTSCPDIITSYSSNVRYVVLSYSPPLSFCLNNISIVGPLSDSLSLLTFSISDSLSLSFSFYLSLSLPISLSLTLSASVSLFACHSLSLSISLPLTLSIYLSFSISLSLSLSLFISISLTLSIFIALPVFPNYTGGNNGRGEGWRGSSVNNSSNDLTTINQSSVSGVALTARTAVDRVLRYDKSVFLSVHSAIKKAGEQTQASDILK